MNMNFNFRNPTNLFFGRGALNKLGEQILPGKKPCPDFQRTAPEFLQNPTVDITQGLKQGTHNWLYIPRVPCL